MITIVIPAYKNTDQFIDNLKKNAEFLKGNEVIVVNDFPEQSLKESLSQFSWLKLIENKKNLGFGGAVNVGVQNATKKYVMLLNTDVVLTDDSYKKALEHFEKDDSLFAVSFAQKEKDGSTVGKNKIFFSRGLVQHSKADDLTFGINGWAECGSCLIDKEKFNQLGGLDKIYYPFYWEDVDLSYNAWKSGYKILFDPEVLVEHHHESTIGKYFDKNKVKVIAYRNQMMFTWKNISQKKYCIQYFFNSVLMKFVMTFKREGNYFKGYFNGVIKFPQVMQSRLKVCKNWKLSDEEIFNKFK